MAGEPLPPVVQEFIANVEPWVTALESAAESSQVMVEAAAKVSASAEEMSAALNTAATEVADAYARIDEAASTGSTGLDEADAKVSAGAEQMATATNAAAAEVESAYGKLGTSANAGAAELEAADAKVSAGATEMATGVEGAVAKVEGSYAQLGTAANAGTAELEAADAKVASGAEEMATATSAAVAKTEGSYAQLGSGASAGTAELEAADEKVSAGAEQMAGVVEAAAAKVEASFGKLAESANAAAGTIEAADARIAKASDEAAAASEAGAAKQATAAETSAAKSGEAATASEGMSSRMKTAFLAVGAGAAIGIDQAMKFQGAMTQLNTQAGVAKDQLGNLQGTFGTLGDGVLKLAGQVGFSPDSLAESLFHVESNMASLGIKAPQALNMVKIAAEGAAVGHAKLVDVTNALTAAVASGIPGVQNINSAMGELNATVGAGDMKMQDLADAMGTGMVAVVKGYGLSIKDVGAALAVFGDNNIRGAKAGTDLRMAVQALAVPAKAGAGALKDLGLTTDSFAKDMRSGGLLKALEDLEQKFKDNGVTAKEQGAYITEIFGKKAGAGIAVLLSQMDRVRSKYPDIQKAGDNFASASATQQKTMEQQWKNLTNGLDALAIKFGTALLPAATKLTDALSKLVNWFTKGGTEANIAAGVIGGALTLAIGGKMLNSVKDGFNAFKDLFGVIGKIGPVISKLGPLFSGLFGALQTVIGAVGKLSIALLTSPWFWVIAAIVLLVLGFAVLWEKCAGFRDFWKGLWNDIKGAFDIAWGGIKEGLSWLTSAIEGMPQAFQQVWDTITSAVKTAWNAIVSFFKSVWTTIKSDATTAWNDFTSWLASVWDTIKSAATTAWNAFVSWIKSVWTTIKTDATTAWDAFTSWIAGVWDTIKAAATTAWDAFVSWIKSIWDTIKTDATTAWNDFTSWISGVWNGIISTATTAWNGFVSWIKGIWTTIRTDATNAWNNIITDMENVGINIINGIIKGLNSAVSYLINGVSNIATTVANTIKSVLGIASPSRVFHEIGQDIVMGLCDGMRYREHEAYRFMRQFGQNLQNSFSAGPNLVNAFTGTSVSSYPGLGSATTGAGATGGGNVIQNFNIQGSVVAETQLRQLAQQGVLRYTRRNPGNGWFLAGRQS